MADDRRIVFDFIGRDRVTQTMRRIGDEAENLDGQMAATGASAAALAGPVAAAGVAFAAFAAVAIPSVTKVISAQEDLAGSWDSLSKGQKASAMMVRGLSTEFKALAKSYEPQALGAFNGMVATARGLMPELSKVVGQSAQGVTNFVGQLSAFAGGPEVSSFLTFAGEMAPQALDEMGQAATTTGSIALTLVKDMAPLGLSLLQLANGTLTAVNAVASFNPMLAQLAITTVLLRGPITAMVGGVTNMAGRMRNAAGGAAGLSRSAKLLNLAAAAGPALYIAAGAAVGFWAIKAMTAKSGHEKLLDAMRIEHRAVGNNLAGHQSYTKQLEQEADVLENKAIRAQLQMSDAARRAVDPARAQTLEVGRYKKELNETNDQLEKQRAVTQRVQTGLELLSAKYGISSMAAQQLATAAGVDLSTAIDKSGKLSGDATAKIVSYRTAVDQARNPTQAVALAMQAVGNAALTMDDRIKGAQTALETYFNPSLAAFNATTQLKGAVAELGKAFGGVKGRLDGTSESSRQARTAFSGVLQATTELWQATIRKDKTDVNANRTLRAQLPILYAMTQGDKDLRAQVDALARSTGNNTGRQGMAKGEFMKVAASMGIAKDKAHALWREYQKLPKQTGNAADGIVKFQGRSMKALHAMSDKELDVTVYANGKFKRASTAGLNAGGPVPWLKGAVPGKDSVPSMLTPDEHVWTDQEVRKAGGHEAVERLRALALAGKLAGYKVGGAVTFKGHTPSKTRLGTVMHSSENAHVRVWRNQRAAYEMAESLATVWEKYAKSAGGVVGSARSQIGWPYSWGGGGRGGPSFGIGRGAGTYGFDCSGLTEYAWWKGARVGIGGTTFSQFPNSTPSPRRPGALGFPHMGHVVLASDNPARIIEAPYTGAHVREVNSSRGYQWRWPKGARGHNLGGRVQRLGQDAAMYGGAAAIRAAKLAGVASDPGRRRALGGPVAAGESYLVGEEGPEIFTPRHGGRVRPGGSTVITINRLELRFADDRNLYEKGREFADGLKEYARRGGRIPTGTS